MAETKIPRQLESPLPVWNHHLHFAALDDTAARVAATFDVLLKTIILS